MSRISDTRNERLVRPVAQWPITNVNSQTNMHEYYNSNQPDPLWNLSFPLFITLTFILLCTIGIVGLICLYIIHGIQVLINTKSVADKCTSSHLEIFVIINMIVLFIVTIYQLFIFLKNVEKNFTVNVTKTFYVLMMCICINIGFGVWAHEELYNFAYESKNITLNNITELVDNCIDLRESELWRFALINMIIQFIIGFIVMAFNALFVLYYNINI